MTISKSVTPMQAVTNAAYNAAKSTMVLKTAFIHAGGNQDEPRKALIVGRIMYALNYTQEKALIALGKKGFSSKSENGDTTRTEIEEKAYGAARVYLSARLKEWGLVTTSSQGGNRVPVAGAEKPMDTEKLKSAPKFKVNNILELAAFCEAHASQGYDFFLLNRAHEAVTDECGSELMAAFADHLDTIKEIIAKHNVPKN